MRHAVREKAKYIEYISLKPCTITLRAFSCCSAMVSFSSFFRKIFASRKQSRQTESSPPPYDDQEIPDEATLTDEKLSHLLNPDLKFTAEEIESQLVKKDAAFASAVVELMLPRLRLGVWQEPVGWGHYSYTLDKVRTHVIGELYLLT